MMVSFCAVFFPRRVLDEFLNLIESVSEGFSSYSYIQNPVPEHEFCLGVMGEELTELPHKAYTSNAVACLINTQIYSSSVFSAVNSLTMVESEEFGMIEEFPYALYKVLVGSADVVWYKVLVAAFSFEHVVSLTSLLCYATKQKVAARSGDGYKICAFRKYCKIIQNRI